MTGAPTSTLSWQRSRRRRAVDVERDQPKQHGREQPARHRAADRNEQSPDAGFDDGVVFWQRQRCAGFQRFSTWDGSFAFEVMGFAPTVKLAPRHAQMYIVIDRVRRPRIASAFS